MTKQIILLMLAAFLLASCSKEQIFQVKNEGSAATDSMLLCRLDSTIKINIGDRLRCSPVASQFIENDTTGAYYVMLDENSLNWFDGVTGGFVKSKKLEGCGTLNNYSGFLCLKDTTFVYNYKQKVVYMLDSVFEIRKSFHVINDGKVKNNLDPEALTDSPMLYLNGRLMLSGALLGDIKDHSSDEYSISCNISISDNKKIYGIKYPEPYEKGSFGGVYFNYIYHTLGSDGNYLYSFPADHCVYSYLSDFSGCQKIYMGSRYSPTIYSSDFNAFELFRDKDLRIKYYVSQHSYSNILYDKYRKLYYRIASHPLDNWDSDSFRKPFSIIIMDTEGRLVSETPIQKDYESLNLHNMHVTQDGLLIQKSTLDENSIEFVVYKILENEN